MKIRNVKIENFRAIQSLSAKATISDGMLLFEVEKRKRQYQCMGSHHEFPTNCKD